MGEFFPRQLPDKRKKLLELIDKYKPIARLFTDKESRERLAQLLQKCPDPKMALTNLVRLAEEGSSSFFPQHVVRNFANLEVLLTLLSYSQLIADTMSKNPDFLPWLFKERGRWAIKSKEDLSEELSKFIFTLSDLPIPAILTRFKKREYLRIWLRDVLGIASLSETTQELSLLADVIMEKAYTLCYQMLTNRFGIPQFIDTEGRINEAEFCIISLGKLGGNELNYSSDIDLLFIYSEDGETTGVDGSPRSQITNKEFFVKLAEDIVEMISSPTPEGLCFRVDLRLRPLGKVGELALPLKSCLHYYWKMASQWEHQALIKVRPSAGSLLLGSRFVKSIQNIIYPPDLDLSVLQAIQDQKDKIDQHLATQGKNLIDIKEGWGGIREVEFIIQGLQLLYGGKESWVRVGNSLQALQRLADKELITFAQYSELHAAYCFLRKMEHRLQMLHHIQTHCLPTDKEKLNRLARRMGFTAEDDQEPRILFMEELNMHRAVVRGAYDNLFRRFSQQVITPLGEELPFSLEAEFPSVEAKLSSLGFREPEQSFRYLKGLSKVWHSGTMPEGVKDFLGRLIPKLGVLLEGLVDPDRAVKNLERFATSLAREEAGVDFLPSYATVAEPLLRLFERSDFLSEILIRHPELILKLAIDSGKSWPQSRAKLHEELWRRVKSYSTLKEKMDKMRQYKQEVELLIGVADVKGALPLPAVNHGLSILAEACIQVAYQISREELFSLYEQLSPSQNQMPAPSFAVIALGRLGSGELEYGSDVDLLFVCSPSEKGSEKEISSHEFFTKLAELMIKLLSGITSEGYLYNVDMRLRPSGREGELVQTVGSLESYFRDKAQVWERQSYIKARLVAGEEPLGREVIRLLGELIYQNLETQSLDNEINRVRDRINLELGGGLRGDKGIKTGYGGLIDVQFIIQYLFLKHQLPLPEDRRSLSLLEYLYQRDYLLPDSFRQLSESCEFLQKLEHQLRLIYDRPMDHLPWDERQLEKLGRFLGYSSDSKGSAGEKLQEEFRYHTDRITSLFDSFLKVK